jgi:hypothetical protein
MPAADAEELANYLACLWVTGKSRSGIWRLCRALCEPFHTRMELVFHALNGIEFPEEAWLRLKRTQSEGDRRVSSAAYSRIKTSDKWVFSGMRKIYRCDAGLKQERP